MKYPLYTDAHRLIPRCDSGVALIDFLLAMLGRTLLVTQTRHLLRNPVRVGTHTCKLKYSAPSAKTRTLVHATQRDL